MALTDEGMVMPVSPMNGGGYGGFGGDWGSWIILFLIFQEKLVKGMMAGAVKG